MISVFVYGTLLVGESNHYVVEPYLLSVTTGAVRGSLYQVGDYPALALPAEPDDERIVIGEWLKVTEEGLSAMDILEDYYGPGQTNEYERVWIRDRNGLHEGWVYIWTDVSGLTEITSGSWKAR
ncbi:gamma-glutamylcyclotransferase [Paenibacillus ferrarius]|uniref:Gamma-glutamylcyclotransferase n=1 Tax=Paenibacillus ferrarius TaxID=1469647 RepID=A0A1V4HEB5_9BACL|nr:gamma-glutamylcyclotransferase family protein [Paenibacillus ferrarius]OPH52005.1 gamma-glutamylcyclotransferase [Paenibacillus ferrarius]